MKTIIREQQTGPCEIRFDVIEFEVAQEPAVIFSATASQVMDAMNRASANRLTRTVELTRNDSAVSILVHTWS